MDIIDVRNIKKSYGKKQALRGVDFSIEQGMIYGLLGPNGSGKSTIINILSGLLSFNSGTCKIFDLDIKEKKSYIQKRIGVVPQEYSLYDDLRAKENVELFARLYGMGGGQAKGMVKEALSLVDLWDERNMFPKSFSGGMKRRLNIACSLVHNPKVLIMDEPTASLDPISRDYILDTVKKLNNNGTTIMYTSHYLEEVEQLCHKATILNNGQVVAEGTTKDIKNMIPNTNRIILSLNYVNMNLLSDIEKMFVFKENVKLLPSKKHEILEYRREDINRVHIECSNVAKVLELLLPYLRSKRIEVKDIQVSKISLEEVFLRLVNRENI